MLAGSVDSEMRLIKEIAGRFSRHPLQKNGLLEADSEILDLSNTVLRYLVLKTDSICEEIKEKLYEDPYVIGWMAVTVTLSDLAATGAVAHGLLLTLQIPRETDEAWLSRFQDGINEACNLYDVYILGGDTNFDNSVSVSTTAVGTVNEGIPLMRKNITPGDLLFVTGPLGSGNAYAYSRYLDPRLNIGYAPIARLCEGRLLKDCASACIDTSDGLFPALSVLSELNNIGFDFEQDLEHLLHHDARRVAIEGKIPTWMLLAGPHGEYELLFAVKPEQKQAMQEQFEHFGAPIYLAKATESKAIQFTSGALDVSCAPSLIANLYHQSNGDVSSYFELLKHQHQKWCVTE